MPVAGRSPHSIAGTLDRLPRSLAGPWCWWWGGGGGCVCVGECPGPQRGAWTAKEPTTASQVESRSEGGLRRKGLLWREDVRTRAPPSALKGKYQAPTRTWKVRFGPRCLPFVGTPSPRSTAPLSLAPASFHCPAEHHPASPPAPCAKSRPRGVGKCRGTPCSVQPASRRMLGQRSAPEDFLAPRPGGCRARVVDQGRGLGRGARCSPVKAPTAFLMSSALSKSVIDILQLFERAEQVRKD